MGEMEDWRRRLSRPRSSASDSTTIVGSISWVWDFAGGTAVSLDLESTAEDMAVLSGFYVVSSNGRRQNEQYECERRKSQVAGAMSITKIRFLSSHTRTGPGVREGCISV